ncbi:hypothetical protein K1719_006813 [Acacia pycnantha]|nr:hypothetical protein K1719_006813 [Acacia pycnantha]
MIVIERSLSGAQSRSVFGLFNVPAKWYAFILLVVFQLLMSNLSLLGHLCGILSGFAYTYGLFNFLLLGTSFYSAIETSSLLSSCVRRPKFIVCTGGNSSGYIPTHSSENSTSTGLLSGNLWRNLSSMMPQREVSTQPGQDNRLINSWYCSTNIRWKAGRFKCYNSSCRCTTASGCSSSDEKIKKLVSMGFDRTQVEVALAAADGDLNVAVEILMSQQS